MAISPAIMGIVNVTPDSFFPSSRVASAAEAIERGRRFFDEGADVVDVGGESTRPGAAHVSVDEELGRVLESVSALARDGVVSIDTQKEPVARAALAAGATILNDVSGTLVEVAGEWGRDYVAMHRKGTASDMQVNPRYDDVVVEVSDYLEDLARRARRAGVGRLWLDPGIGFGKTLEHNLELLSALEHFVALAARYDAEVLVGTSRKRFLEFLGAPGDAVESRLEASLATAAWSMLKGVSMVRVHDVAATVALRELLTRPLDRVGA
ncbi:MAG TPA: dihydropteroate synthase [Acidimicrobiales bacterium]|nr:dihydropteroate synthase [Acidimicrobiales bacterium]